MGTETSCAFCGTDVGGASVCSRCLLDQNAPELVELRAVSGELFRVEAEIKLLRQKAVELDGKPDALQAVLQWRRRPAPQRTTISDRTPISTDRCATSAPRWRRSAPALGRHVARQPQLVDVPSSSSAGLTRSESLLPSDPLRI